MKETANRYTLREINPPSPRPHKVALSRAIHQPDRSGCEAWTLGTSGLASFKRPLQHPEKGHGRVCLHLSTKLNVQHWLDDDDNASDNMFEGMICPACTRLHMINRKTGRLLGEKTK